MGMQNPADMMMPPRLPMGMMPNPQPMPPQQPQGGFGLAQMLASQPRPPMPNMVQPLSQPQAPNPMMGAPSPGLPTFPEDMGGMGLGSTAPQVFNAAKPLSERNEDPRYTNPIYSSPIQEHTYYPKFDFEEQQPGMHPLNPPPNSRDLRERLLQMYRDNHPDGSY